MEPQTRVKAWHSMKRKLRAAEKGGRSIGENKPKMTETEKDEAYKRHQIEEYIKRMSMLDEG